MRVPNHRDEATQPSPPPVDDEERAFRASFARMVDWYRVKQSRALVAAFGPAFLLLPLGSFVVALSMMQRLVPIHLQAPLTLLGLLVTASGPLWAIVHLLRSIRRDLYVAIRVDGLCVRLDPRERESVYAWDSIEDARYDETQRALSVSLIGREPVAISATFSELDLPELGKRIRDARRLAVWNRLEPRFGAEGEAE
jgi:hypothetical protein